MKSSADNGWNKLECYTSRIGGGGTHPNVAQAVVSNEMSIHKCDMFDSSAYWADDICHAIRMDNFQNIHQNW